MVNRNSKKTRKVQSRVHSRNKRPRRNSMQLIIVKSSLTQFQRWSHLQTQRILKGCQQRKIVHQLPCLKLQIWYLHLKANSMDQMLRHQLLDVHNWLASMEYRKFSNQGKRMRRDKLSQSLVLEWFKKTVANQRVSLERILKRTSSRTKHHQKNKKWQLFQILWTFLAANRINLLLQRCLHKFTKEMNSTE